MFLQKSTGSCRRSRSAATTAEMRFRPTTCRRSQLRPPTRQHRRRRSAADATRPSSSSRPATPLNRARTLHHPHTLIRTLSLARWTTRNDTRAMLGAAAAERSNFFKSVAVQPRPNLPSPRATCDTSSSVKSGDLPASDRPSTPRLCVLLQ